jgi:GxxExxY protein
VKFEELSGQVIGCAIEVHRELGPGLLESSYEKCLAHELSKAGIPFETQVAIPVLYKGVTIDCGYRADLLVDKKVLVELKSAEKIERLHEAQLLTYMRLAGVQVGLLINFNVAVLKDGIKRYVL